MTNGISVRAARREDAGALLTMIDALNAHSGLATGKLDAAAMEAALFGRAAFVFADIAEASGAPIGYALSHDAFTSDVCERGVYLVDLYVEAQYRGTGAGRALMAATARRAKKRGATHLWWASYADNKEAQKFYRRLGASEEALTAHALTGDAFDRMARL